MEGRDHRRSRRPGSFVAGLALAFGLLAAPVVIPSDAPVPQALKAGTAEAKPKHCKKLAKKTAEVSRGKLTSAPEAFRNTKGCGDTLSDKLCEASRKKNGEWARKMVRTITRGESSTC